MTKEDRFDLGVQFLGLINYGMTGAKSLDYLAARIDNILKITYKYARVSDDYLSMVQYICKSMIKVMDGIEFNKVNSIGIALNHLLPYVNDDNVIDTKYISGDEYKRICNDMLVLVNHIYPIIDIIDNVIINDQSLCCVFVKRRSMHFEDSGD